MKPKKTPQEKKKLSYEKDRRNDYGENNKSSRKAIKKRKSWVNQTYRRSIKQTIKTTVTLADEEIENIDPKIKEVKRKDWKKIPDKPLGEYLKEKGKLKKKKS